MLPVLPQSCSERYERYWETGQLVKDISHYFKESLRKISFNSHLRKTAKPLNFTL